jgi:hypothetical protein
MIAIRRAGWWFLALAFASAAPAGAQLVTPAQRAHFQSDYARYAEPEQCLAAMARAEKMAIDWQHPMDADTLPFLPTGLPLPPAAARVIRDCSVQLRPASVAAYEFPALMMTYWLGGQTDLARSAVRARLQALAAGAPRAAATRAQAALLRDLVMNALPNDPLARKWPAEAAEYGRQLDSLGASAVVEQQIVHARFKEYAWAMGDFVGAVREAERVIALGHAMSDAQQSGATIDLLGAAYLTLLTNSVIQGNTTDPNSAAAKAAKAVSIRKARDQPLIAKFVPPFVFELYVQLNNEIFHGWSAEALPVHGTYWYNRPDTLARPGAAAVTAVALQDFRPEEFQALRRLAKRYGPRGFELVVTAKTQGWFENSSVLTPAQEADSLRWSFLDHMQLPAVLAIETTSFTMRDVDSVRLAQPTAADLEARERHTPNFGLYRGRTLVVAFLWTIGGLHPQRENEAAIGKLIERLLSERQK